MTAGADMFDAARVMAEYNEAKIEAARSGGLVAGGLSIVINSHNRPGPLAIVMEALADWTGPLLVVDDSDDADAIKRVVGDRGQVVRVGAETYAAGMSDADVAACRRMEVLSRRMLAALGEPTKVAA